MTDTDLIASLPERDILALTLWGEARSEPIEGRIAIANVVRNRVTAQRASFGLTPREVCLKPWQFSCWRLEGGAENYAQMMDAARLLDTSTRATGLLSPIFRECLWIAEGLLTDRFGDNTKGSTHYLTVTLYRLHPPAWAIGHVPTVQINSHLFFKGVA